MKLHGLVSTFMYMWTIYIFPGSVCLFGCSKIGRPFLRIYKSLTDARMWKLGDRTIKFFFGNNEATQFHFWEYINRNQAFILVSQQPFICSVYVLYSRTYMAKTPDTTVPFYLSSDHQILVFLIFKYEEPCRFLLPKIGYYYRGIDYLIKKITKQTPRACHPPFYLFKSTTY